MKNKIINLIKKEWIFLLLICWCISSLFFFFYSGENINSVANYSKISILFWGAVFIIVFLILLVINLLVKEKRINHFLLPIVFFIYSIVTATSAGNIWYSFALIVLWYILFKYYKQKLYSINVKSNRGCLIIIAIMTLIFIVIGCSIAILEYKSYHLPNYDFGIFSQMFYSMKRILLPVTTCERDALLSHFAIHISPILYLLLPIYSIFSTPLTLLIMQVLLISSSVIPVYLLCKHYNLSYEKTIFAVLVLLLFPTILGGTLTGFHENCFLLPLLLWAFYFLEKNNFKFLLLFSFLVLLVKEDAFIYIAFLGLYMLIGRKQVFYGLVLMLLAGIYFSISSTILSFYGEGIMSYRYSNFFVNDGSLLDAIANTLKDPALALSQMFKSEDGYSITKVLFILEIFVPLAFIPFNTKKISNLLLLLPFILINLLSLYTYQYDIGYQYSFASTAFIMYLVIINISSFTKNNSHILILSVVASLLIFSSLYGNKLIKCVTFYKSNYANIKIIDKELKRVPSNAKIAATTFLIPHLSNRDTIYEVYYHEPQEDENLDYIIIDDVNNHKEFISKYEKLGYKVVRRVYGNDKKILLIIMK